MAHPKIRYDAIIACPFGRLGIVLRDARLVDLNFLPAATTLIPPRTPFARQVCAQLRAYIKNPRTRFALPLALDGTLFQHRVWRALQRIPTGEVTSYGVLARQLKSSARAVGNACRANPVAIIVPCHRVVSASGDGGFMGRRSGRALTIKRWLLDHERRG